MKLLMLGQYPKNPPNIEGGIEAVVYNLCNELAKKREIDLTVATLRSDIDNDYIRKYNGYKIYYLKIPPLPLTINLLSFGFFKIYFFIKKFNPDIVHVHGYDIYLLPTIISKTKNVVTIHGILEVEFNLHTKLNKIFKIIKSAFWNYVINFNLRHVKNFISISPYVKEYLKNKTNANIFNIYNPVSKDFFNISRDNFIKNKILYVGRIEPRKNLFLLVKAINEIVIEYPNIKLTVIGGVDKKWEKYYNVIRNFIQKNDLEKNIEILGYVDHKILLDEYTKSSIFCLPSLEESSPVAVAQSLAAGLPVLSSDAKGFKHLVIDYYTGIKFKNNDLSDLVYKLKTILNYDKFDPKIIKEFAHNEFDIEKIIEKVIKLYLRILN